MNTLYQEIHPGNVHVIVAVYCTPFLTHIVQVVNELHVRFGGCWITEYSSDCKWILCKWAMNCT
jgi:uncharacterized protein (DUF2237 family)